MRLAPIINNTVISFDFFKPNRNSFDEFSIVNIVDKTVKLLHSKFMSQNIEIIKADFFDFDALPNIPPPFSIAGQLIEATRRNINATE